MGQVVDAAFGEAGKGGDLRLREALGDELAHAGEVGRRVPAILLGRELQPVPAHTGRPLLPPGSQCRWRPDFFGRDGLQKG